MNTTRNPDWSYPPNPVHQVNSVDLSDDGTHCVYASSSEYEQGQFSFYCLDGEGRELWSVPLAQPCERGFFGTAISGNGCYAAAGGEYTTQGDGFLKAYDVNGLGASMLEVSGLAGRINQVALNYQGDILAAVYSSTLQVYRRYRYIAVRVLDMCCWPRPIYV